MINELNINQIMQGAKKVGISGHVKPDGDCVGSCLALYQYLQQNFNAQIVLFLESIPDEFLFLNGTDQICHEARKEQFDVYFALDCGDETRLGFAAPMYHQAYKKVCIDHHCSNTGFAEFNYIVPEASSTSELIYDILDKDKINTQIAECIYMGIVHDTGVFQYSCTSPKTMITVSELMKYDFDFSSMIDRTFNEKTFAQNQVMGEALIKAKRHLNNQVISSIICQDDMKKYGARPSDLEGVVSQLRVTKGVEIAVFLYENDDHTYKVSMRSKKCADVAKIAVQFGGGGHVRAAGVTMSGDPEAILSILLEEIKKELEP